jgi:RNA polymerase sigma-70 factor (ECF subfamily)
MGVMPAASLPESLVARLYGRARADRWSVDRHVFAAALERSAQKAGPGDGARGLERYLNGLHLEDLALACACAQGHEEAWEHFVREHRPALYRAADAIDPTGGCRDLADSLYGELFGVSDKGGARQSLLTYFHGRSSLSTWLRAVLAQRHVDRIRTTRRFEPIAEEEPPAAAATATGSPLEEGYLPLLGPILREVLQTLVPRDRLRLAYYYAQDLSLAQIGRALGEHEATVSRNLARVRRELRGAIEQRLRERHGMDAEEIARCFASVAGDAGDLDVAELLGPAPGPDSDGRKQSRTDRSKDRREGANA